LILNENLIQRLLTVISRQFGYSMNVMDSKAIIVASTNLSRVGNFHQGAYEILEKKRSVHVFSVSTKDELIGVRPGITYPLYVQNQLVGAFGISGDPEMLTETAKLLKVTFETMLEYEILKHQRKTSKRTTADVDILNMLLFDTPIDPERLRVVAKRSNVDLSIQRCPLIFRFEDDVPMHLLLRLLKSIQSDPRFKNDLFCLAFETSLVAFCALPDNGLPSLKQFIAARCEEILLFAKQQDEMLKPGKCAVFGGVPIDNCRDYNIAYNHLWWALSRLNGHVEQGRTYHILEFLADSALRRADNENLFYLLDYYFHRLTTINIDTGELVKTIHCWLASGMNYNTCAQNAFLHKNTVKLRLGKIEAALELEDIKDINSIVLLYMLERYEPAKASEFI
jgi:carbohydrate diacid regulator